MSAFIVSEQHINAIVQYVTRGGRETIRFRRSRGIMAELTADQLGRELWTWNVMSVNFRYADDKQDIPSKYVFKFNPMLSIDALGAIKLLKCLEYQSCELTDWETSDGALLIRDLIYSAINNLDNYESRKWAI